jgi:O-antigen/teichoic acid export membrane protein
MKTLKNLSWQFFGQGIGKASIFLFYLLLPLSIGLQEYGKFSFALAVSFIIVQPLVEMGLDIIIAKWVSRGKVDVVKKAFIIRVITSFIALALLCIVSLFLKVDRGALFLLFPYFVLIAFQYVIFSFFRGIENMKLEGLIVLVQKISVLVLLFVLGFLGFKNALLGSLTLLCSAFFGGAILLVISRQQVKEIIKSKTDFLGYNDLIKEGIVLGGVAFLWVIYFRVDTVMLGMMRDNVDVGLYNVAYRIMEGIFFLPSIIMIVFFPMLAKSDRFKEIFGKLLFIFGGSGLGASIALYLFSPGLIKLIYGPNFFGSIAVLQTLALVILPVFLGYLTTTSLVALDLHKVYLLVALLGAVLNIILNYFFIPLRGAVGAAGATLVTEIFVTALCGYFVLMREPEALRSSLTAAKETVSRIVRTITP